MGFDDVKQGDGDLMRYIKNGINVIFLAIMLWIGKNVQESSMDIAILHVMVANLTVQLNETRASMTNRYSSADAEKDFHIRDAALIQLEARLNSLDSVVRVNRDAIERFRSLMPTYVPREK